MSNEPGEHWPYLYDYCGKPWITRHLDLAGDFPRLRQYSRRPARQRRLRTDIGFWFFPRSVFVVNPASGNYMIGSPLFRRVTLSLGNGKTFTLEAEDNTDTNVYIQSATLNDAPLDAPTISWAQIQAGGTLHFVLENSPSDWAAKWSGKPVLPGIVPRR